MRPSATLALCLLLLPACGDNSLPTVFGQTARLAANVGPSPASGGATHTEGQFFAMAACADDIGFNIRFGGSRVLVRHVAGEDTTLSFRTQDFQGWKLPETTFDQTTVDYDVLGGAEMFNIKRDESGALQVRIHEGTLVFESLDGSHKVVARHTIRTVPGQGTMVDDWRCRIIG